MLPLAAFDHSGAIVHDDGRLAHVVALDSPNALLIDATGARRLADGLAGLVADARAAGTPIQLHIQGVGAPSDVARRHERLAIEAHVVCHSRSSGSVFAARTRGTGLMARRASETSIVNPRRDELIVKHSDLLKAIVELARTERHDEQPPQTAARLGNGAPVASNCDVRAPQQELGDG
jgi:hypothetical protein